MKKLITIALLAVSINASASITCAGEYEMGASLKFVFESLGEKKVNVERFMENLDNRGEFWSLGKTQATLIANGKFSFGENKGKINSATYMIQSDDFEEVSTIYFGITNGGIRNGKMKYSTLDSLSAALLEMNCK